MEVTTQGMPYEAWKDNEYIEDLVKKLQESGTNVVVGSFDKLINWGRSNSIGRSPLPPVAAASNLCRLEPPVMTWRDLAGKLPVPRHAGPTS